MTTTAAAISCAATSASDTAYLWEPAVYQTNAYAAANNLNQYPTVTRTGIPSVLAYDANGNLTSDGVQTFGYDAENRLITAVKSGMSAAYTYDPMGRRAAKTVNTVSTFFLLSDDEEIGEYNASGSLIRRYVTGPGTDQPIAMVGTGSSPTRDYFHTDRIGSVVAMTDNSGHVSQGPFTYDAYGQSAQTGGVPFRFTGRRLDPETGLYYFRARYYSAAEGRFLQADPVGYKDQMNLYAYVNNDPISTADPSGECSPDGQTGLCGNDKNAKTLINSVNNTVGQHEQSYEGLRQLDADAQKLGFRVGVNVVDKGGASDFQESDPLNAAGTDAEHGSGSGGTITVDLADARSEGAKVLTSPTKDAESGTAGHTRMESPTAGDILVHEAQHASDSVHGILDQNHGDRILQNGPIEKKSEVRAVRAENRYRAVRGSDTRRIIYGRGFR